MPSLGGWGGGRDVTPLLLRHHQDARTVSVTPAVTQFKSGSHLGFIGPTYNLQGNNKMEKCVNGRMMLLCFSFGIHVLKLNGKDE